MNNTPNATCDDCNRPAVYWATVRYQGEEFGSRVCAQCLIVIRDAGDLVRYEQL